jgi:16S rRNA processing protein RimM
MDREGYFLLGRITKAHGLKGAVQVMLEASNPDDYLDLESIFVEHKQRLIPFFIEEFSLQGQNRGIIKFEDVDNIDQAKNYMASSLYIKEDEVSEEDLEAQESMEVIGFQIIDQNLGELGTVSDYYEKVGQDLLAFEYKGQEVLIPIDESIILEINPDTQTVRTVLPDGLLDIYFSPQIKDDGDED